VRVALPPAEKAPVAEVDVADALTGP
jgi:hypothetical protein